MPITGIGSYRSTGLEFREHWTRANAALAPEEVILTGDYTLSDFVTDYDDLIGAIDAVAPLIDELELLSDQRDRLKEHLIERVVQFRRTVSGLLAGSSFAHDAPTAPGVGSGRDAFLLPVEKMARFWRTINALTPETAAHYGAVPLSHPLTLSGGYTLVQFEADKTNLAELWPQWESKDEETQFKRDFRDQLIHPFHERLKQYRQVIQGQFPKGSAIYTSLPRLTPPQGETPPPVGAVGVWECAQNKARLSWEAIDSPKIARLSVRTTPGSSYRNEDETTLADLDIQAREFFTSQGLSAPGATASFKVYAVGPHGNENGGKAVKIVRPLAPDSD